MQMQEQDKRTEALRQLNQELLHDERILLSIVPVGDGMALCMKLWLQSKMHFHWHCGITDLLPWHTTVHHLVTFK